MSSTSWHARIACGGEVGAGFLVSGRRVLTCAHVIRRSEASAVTVSFPHSRGLGPLTATVIARGDWAGGATDPGDLAVLELDREVPLAPAVFAPPGDAYADPHPKLIAYGFPRGYDEGTLAEYRATSDQLIADEWIQLEAWSPHGQPLAAGFSGAAVTLADGRVVGMVSAASGARDVRNGRMLPSHVMARYWPGLGELIPTPDHRPDAQQRLRRLVQRAEALRLPCDPDRLYVDAVGPLGPQLPDRGFDSLWAAAWYVLCEVPDPQAVTRFADRLAELLGTPPGRSRTPSWSPILVEIEHTGAGGDQVNVEVSACRDGLRRPVGALRLPRTGVRAYVQEHIDKAFNQLAPGSDELIAFVLPREWLNEPVAHWARSADDDTPLGCVYPLVVTDRTRRRGGVRHQLIRKWQDLEGKPGASLHRIDCGTDEKPTKLRFRLRHEDAHLAAFSLPPARTGQLFEVTLNAPVPVLLWTRTGCAGGPEHDGSCVFLDELTAYAEGLAPAELPRHIMALRETVEASDAPDRHWAKDVQLLWDDPRRFPEPAAPLSSPVA
ncbi:serine protease [Streptomyces albiflavescens]|uniref:Serine protease n=1 Tax=Streptomyces albiflavescens TaxID=1623582 RepID=A0A918D1G3_9ACTN|nr:trypsin-like peptidase domain-containing protein [Streptomyces albiflavescens]GGN56410.1 serine protease [Streptomyces albiflavescens]